MDEFSSADILEKQNRKKKFAFLEVGLFEVSFVLIIIIVLFGLLNYYNILSLSKLYPNTFGFLPHQQTTSKQLTNNLIQTPTPTPIFTGYDWNNAQKVLEKFLRDNINPEFLPNKIQGEQGLIGSESTKGLEYEFGVKWRTSTNEGVLGIFHYGLKTNIPSDISFLIYAPSIQNIAVATSENLTKEITQKYLKNIPDNTNFVCRITANKMLTICENINDTPSGKKGFGIEISTVKPVNTAIVFSCFIPKNGIYYNEWHSCIPAAK